MAYMECLGLLGLQSSGSPLESFSLGLWTLWGSKRLASPPNTLRQEALSGSGLLSNSGPLSDAQRCENGQGEVGLQKEQRKGIQ